MGLSEFPSWRNHTRLITHKDTVYKLKLVIDAATPRQQETGSSAAADYHTEIDEVVRAVLFMVENNRPLVKKIRTRHLLVVPSLKRWKVGEVVGFRRKGKELKAFKSVIVFTVTSQKPRNKEKSRHVQAASKTSNSAQNRERVSLFADPVRCTERGEYSVQNRNRNSNSASVGTRDRESHQNQYLQTQSGSQISTTSQTRVGTNPEKRSDHSADPSGHLEKENHHVSKRAQPPLPKASTSHPDITLNNSTDAAAEMSRPSLSKGREVSDRRKLSRGETSTEGSNQMPQKQTSQGFDKQAPSASTTSAQGSSENPYNLRQRGNISLQSTDSPSKRRLGAASDSRTSPSKQNTQSSAISRAQSTDKASSQSVRSNVRFTERSREQVINQTETLAKSPDSRKRPHPPPLSSAQNGGAVSIINRNTEQSRVSSRSTRSDLGHRQNQNVNTASSQSQHALRSAARRVHLAQPIRHDNGTLLSRSQETPTASHYNLRQTVHRGTVLEEQRLKSLATDVIDDDRQREGRLPSSAPAALKTFEQKDRYLVETGDVQEELKLQMLANAHQDEGP